MISFLSSSLARWGVAAALCLAVLIGCYAKGRMDEHKKLVQYKAEVAAAAQAQQDKIDALVARQSQITRQAEVKHEQSLASLRSTYAALRLRSPAGSGDLSAVPDSTRYPAEAAAYYLSVAPELATACAETTQQLIDLQGWTLDQVEAGK